MSLFAANPQVKCIKLQHQYWDTEQERRALETLEPKKPSVLFCGFQISAIRFASPWMAMQSLWWLRLHLTPLKDFVQIWQVGELQDIAIFCEMLRR